MHPDNDSINTSFAQPAEKLQAIRARAFLYQHIREFFSQRQILEVETPLLYTTKVQLNPAVLLVKQQINGQLQTSYLQSSPSSAMQQLLSSSSNGMEKIYQICKVFRRDMADRKHSPEFSMLAWYESDCNLLQLMQHSNDLLTHVFGYAVEFETLSYQQAFMRRLDIDPLIASSKEIKDTIRRVGLAINPEEDRIGWLHSLFINFIEPTLGYNQPLFLTDFPAEMATTANTKTTEHGIKLAARFEVYIDGLKLASGQIESIPQHFRQYSENFHPNKQMPFSSCGHILLGLDRLLMLLMDKRRIDQVII